MEEIIIYIPVIVAILLGYIYGGSWQSLLQMAGFCAVVTVTTIITLKSTETIRYTNKYTKNERERSSAVLRIAIASVVQLAFIYISARISPHFGALSFGVAVYLRECGTGEEHEFDYILAALAGLFLLLLLKHFYPLPCMALPGLYLYRKGRSACTLK